MIIGVYYMNNELYIFNKRGDGCGGSGDGGGGGGDVVNEYFQCKADVDNCLARLVMFLRRGREFQLHNTKKPHCTAWSDQAVAVEDPVWLSGEHVVDCTKKQGNGDKLEHSCGSPCT
jgi:hypothetical protein